MTAIALACRGLLYRLFSPVACGRDESGTQWNASLHQTAGMEGPAPSGPVACGRDEYGTQWNASLHQLDGMEGPAPSGPLARRRDEFGRNGMRPSIKSKEWRDPLRRVR